MKFPPSFLKVFDNNCKIPLKIKYRIIKNLLLYLQILVYNLVESLFKVLIKGGLRLKNLYVIVATLLVETALIWGVSILLNWKMVDIIFLGGLALFGLIWFFQLNSNRQSNAENAHLKGWNGQNGGAITPFQFKSSPVIIGLLLFIVVSFCVTAFTYYPYFID